MVLGFRVLGFRVLGGRFRGHRGRLAKPGKFGSSVSCVVTICALLVLILISRKVRDSEGILQRRKIAQGAGDGHRERLARPERSPFLLALFS